MLNKVSKTAAILSGHQCVIDVKAVEFEWLWELTTMHCWLEWLMVVHTTAWVHQGWYIPSWLNGYRNWPPHIAGWSGWWWYTPQHECIKVGTFPAGWMVTGTDHHTLPAEVVDGGTHHSMSASRLVHSQLVEWLQELTTTHCWLAQGGRRWYTQWHQCVKAVVLKLAIVPVWRKSIWFISFTNIFVIFYWLPQRTDKQAEFDTWSPWQLITNTELPRAMPASEWTATGTVVTTEILWSECCRRIPLSEPLRREAGLIGAAM